MAEMTRDFNSLFYVTELLASEVHTGEATEADGDAKRTCGCRGGAFLVNVPVFDDDATINLTFQHSPDNSNWYDLTPIDYASANIDIVESAELAEDNVVIFSCDELYEGGYVRVQWQVTPDTKDTCEFGVLFVGFRAINRPIFNKWALGELYVVDEVVQNAGFYFKCILAFGRALAEAEVEAGTSVSEPGVGGSTGTYWEIYKGEEIT